MRTRPNAGHTVRREAVLRVDPEVLAWANGLLVAGRLVEGTAPDIVLRSWNAHFPLVPGEPHGMDVEVTLYNGDTGAGLDRPWLEVVLLQDDRPIEVLEPPRMEGTFVLAGKGGEYALAVVPANT